MIVRTVLGDIDPAELGPCDAHEHLFLDTPAQPGEAFLEVDKAIEEARTLVDAGGRSLVDWTPIGLGRDLDGLGAVSRAETASTGATLQLDGPGRTKYWPDSTILGLIADLADAGHADRLLVGGDTGRRNMLRAYGGGPGLDYVFARFKPRLERELGRELAERIFVANPARAFAWAPRA
jgi:predicted metal-dependent phosphotriesterase family hydrolase